MRDGSRSRRGEAEEGGRTGAGTTPHPRRPGSRVLSWIVVLAVVYLAWATFLFLSQGRMIFPGAGMGAPEGLGRDVAGLERLWLDLPGGRTETWFLPPATDTPAPALLFFHGNAELIDGWAAQLDDFTARGLGVMLVEYPGYGRSEGSPSEASVRAAALAAFDTLAAREDTRPDRIVAWGRSVGAGPAAALALERPLAALVLESSFTSVRSFARRYFLPGFLVRHPFDVIGAVRAFDGPVLVVHGRRDRIIPYGHGVALAEAAGRSTLVSYDCGHNDCPPSWPAHVDSVTTFLEREGVLR